jgi:hypothetical protein
MKKDDTINQHLILNTFHSSKKAISQKEETTFKMK